jgi:serine/threonine protein kinase
VIESESDASRSTSGDDALRGLCFCDAVFRERYEGWRVLGRGPWATVVRTRSRDLGHDIAIKVFVNLDCDVLARVRQEVLAVQALASPYLVPIYSLFDRGAIAWFEMEWIDGPSLQQVLDRLGSASDQIPLVRAYEIALALGRCVWHAHRHGVLHRDIKPANVLLPSSGRPVAKLSDFGIARLATLGGSTPSGAVTGTPKFASPEALAGERVGASHDTYGLGVTMYALFARGQLPFDVPEGTSVSSLRRLQLAARPTPLRALEPAMDVRVERLLMRTLDPNPRLRPPVWKLVLALERAQARRAGSAEVPRVPSSTGRWHVAAAGIGLVLLGLWTKLRGTKARGDQPRRGSGCPTDKPPEP